MKRKSFVFYENWFEGIEQIPAELQTEAYRMIVRYGLYGELPTDETNCVLRVLFFSTVKMAIDDNLSKFEEISKRRSEAGKRGMKKRWHSDNSVIATDNKNNKCYQESKSITKITNITSDNINENENENENIDKSIVINNNTLSKPKAFDAETAALNKERREESLAVQEVVSYYNAQIAKHKARLRVSLAKISDRRKQAILARLKERKMNALKQAIDKAVVSSFLNYEASNAPVDLDWIMKQNNLPKILEGKYDNKERKGMNVGRVHFNGENGGYKYKEEEEKWK